eukprot:29418_3
MRKSKKQRERKIWNSTSTTHLKWSRAQKTGIAANPKAKRRAGTAKEARGREEDSRGRRTQTQDMGKRTRTSSRGSCSQRHDCSSPGQGGRCCIKEGEGLERQDSHTARTRPTSASQSGRTRKASRRSGEDKTRTRARKRCTYTRPPSDAKQAISKRVPRNQREETERKTRGSNIEEQTDAARIQGSEEEA